MRCREHVSPADDYAPAGDEVDVLGGDEPRLPGVVVRRGDDAVHDAVGRGVDLVGDAARTVA